MHSDHEIFRKVWLLFPVIPLLISACGGATPPVLTPTPPVSAAPPGELFTACWVAYSPTHYDPNQGTFPSEADIRQDLQTLRDSGFTGLVTYGADGSLGELVPGLAQELGLRLIMGLWDPGSATEQENAITAAVYPSTVGYIVGNEGLHQRYDLPTLENAMDSLRQKTRKPVTTTEEFGDYTDTALLDLGDWVFPNVHPFFAGITDPAQASAWTQNIYDDFKSRTDRPVVFKEVGLPTDGDPQDRLNEGAQAEYYRQLKNTDVNFVYFEAFDSPWKTEPSVEPFWGLFHADRTPKEAAQYVCNRAPLPSAPTPTATPTEPPATSTISTATPNPDVFYVYTDADVSTNHFIPSGYMGDTGDITMNETWSDQPHSGTTAIRVVYDPRGSGPNSCDYAPPCKWAGVYWQNPANNWGTVPRAGYDLRGYTKLTFWARSEAGASVEFKVGGITGQYPDSIQPPALSTGIQALTTEWQLYAIDLSNADLSYVIGGFLWTTSWKDNGIGTDNPKQLVFFLDDIQFEK